MIHAATLSAPKVILAQPKAVTTASAAPVETKKPAPGFGATDAFEKKPPTLKEANTAVTKDLAGAKALASKKDYQGAADAMGTALNKDHKYDGGSLASGKGVMNQAVDGSGDAAATQQKQYQYCADMKAKGVEPKANPPTEKELEAYFAKFKGPPHDKEGAVKAYEKYADAFMVHTSTVDKKNKTYSYGSTSKPGSFADATHPKTSGKHAGKSENDCKGYAVVGHKLLGAAGFTDPQFVAAKSTSDPTGHSMLLVKDQSGKSVVVSNGKIAQGADPKSTLVAGYGLATLQGTPGDMFYGATVKEASENAGEDVAAKKVK